MVQPASLGGPPPPPTTIPLQSRSGLHAHICDERPIPTSWFLQALGNFAGMFSELLLSNTTRHHRSLFSGSPSIFLGITDLHYRLREQRQVPHSMSSICVFKSTETLQRCAQNPVSLRTMEFQMTFSSHLWTFIDCLHFLNIYNIVTKKNRFGKNKLRYLSRKKKKIFKQGCLGGSVVWACLWPRVCSWGPRIKYGSGSLQGARCGTQSRVSRILG